MPSARRQALTPLLILVALASCAESSVAPFSRNYGPCGEIIPGAYRVGFSHTVLDVPARAQELVEKYDGTLDSVWVVEQPPGFAASGLSDDAATGIAKEQGVAYVEPVRIVCTGGV
jgi:hypothetical protein